MSSKEALSIANSKSLDLVKIAPNAEPPVCKIMDYGKYKYEAAKREKDAKKKQKVIVVKELRFRPAIEENDLRTKAKMGAKFLSNGDKLKISVRFKGRELGHKEIGYDLINRFLKIIKDSGTADDKPKMEGNNLVVNIEPVKNK